MKNELNFNHIHPFMAVRREQFADLQKKAEQSPWKEMKHVPMLPRNPYHWFESVILHA